MAEKKKKLRFIQFTYLLGIVLDGLLGIDMFLDAFFGITIYLPNQNIPLPTPDTQSVMILGTSLMIGWTVLLIWGLLKPIERKGTLVITAFPVVTIYLAYDVYSYFSPLYSIELGSWVSILCIRVVLLGLFLLSYIFAKNYEKLNY